jgi:predicted CXXCH cytochrome family protein
LFIASIITSIFVLGDMNVPEIAIICPMPADSISYEPGKLLVVSIAKDIGSQLTLSTQWEKLRAFDLTGEGVRENFPRDFYKFFDSKATIQMMSYSFKLFKGYTKPESLAFAYTDTMTIRGLWQKQELLKFMKALKGSEASEVVVRTKGWRDSTYSAIYDDPSNDTRVLYKLHVQLLPGMNTIYIGPLGQKNKAITYSTSLVMESMPTSERTDRFHNSTVEQSCTSCHDGLPSADNGATMNADCSVCHKEKFGASYLHGPAEMKECGSCHSWSAEKKAVVVEKGVPAVCYDCHDNKQAQVENSKTPHPVASECMTCHSSHGSDQNHIVKADVYTLCTGCHEDQKMNHPVGRHPLRFAKLGNGEEISCVSCHNPHGTDNDAMFWAPVSRMEMCSACH